MKFHGDVVDVLDAAYFPASDKHPYTQTLLAGIAQL